MIFASQEEFQTMVKDAVVSALKECQFQPTTAPATVPNEPKYIHSIKELAALLNCSVVTAQKFKNAGLIPYRQMNRKLIFNVDEVLTAMHGVKVKGGRK